MSVAQLPGLRWAHDADDRWSATDSSGRLIGTIVRTGRYTVLSCDGTVTGSHGSLDAAKHELEAFERWLHGPAAL